MPGEARRYRFFLKNCIHIWRLPIAMKVELCIGPRGANERKCKYFGNCVDKYAGGRRMGIVVGAPPWIVRQQELCDCSSGNGSFGRKGQGP
jgi:hypothetical protein